MSTTEPPAPPKANTPAKPAASAARLPAKLGAALQRAGFTTTMQLLLHTPRRHEDWQTRHFIANLKHGDIAMVEGSITSASVIPARNRRQFLVHLQDAQGDIAALRFFNVTPGLQRFLEVGRHIFVRGKARLTRNGWEFSHPKFTTEADETRSVYPALGGLTSRQLQTLIAQLLDKLAFTPTIPPHLETYDGHDWTLQDCLRAVHAPATDGSSALEADHPAWRRLRFEELVAHLLLLRKSYYYRRGRAARLSPPPAAPVNTNPNPDDWQKTFCAALSFELTRSQKDAIADIAADMRRDWPMRRLLQGDVGSGKTAVAAAAAYLTARAKHTAAFMAPTEILAEQHYQTLSALFEKLHLKCELYTGAQPPRQRQAAENRLRFGLSSIVIGTHALFQQSVSLANLALVVIDEQHRFGVEQRQAFTAKGQNTHQLMMSATPIPRTLALSLYANMDISVLKEKPAGRKPIRTILASSAKREEVMTRIAAHVKDGGRVYWVCPLVEESDKSALLRDVHSVASDFKRACPQIASGVIHGRLSGAEKTAVMEKFRSGGIQLLIATTVIEVGVDVSQADVIVIESADRMGLSQLHQLRGRVGRGDTAGICILLFQPPPDAPPGAPPGASPGASLSEEMRARLKIMQTSEDGFEIARQDLAMRGPGEWLGSRQSGLPSFRVARLGEDEDLTAAAKAAADWMLKNDKRACIRHIRRWLGPPHHYKTSTKNQTEGSGAAASCRRSTNAAQSAA